LLLQPLLGFGPQLAGGEDKNAGDAKEDGSAGLALVIFDESEFLP
jgi:hypothetical protein